MNDPDAAKRIEVGLGLARHIVPRDGATYLLAGTTLLIEQYEDGMEQVIAATLEVEDRLHEDKSPRTLDERLARARELIAGDRASDGPERETAWVEISERASGSS